MDAEQYTEELIITIEELIINQLIAVQEERYEDADIWKTHIDSILVKSKNKIIKENWTLMSDEDLSDFLNDLKWDIFKLNEEWIIKDIKQRVF